MAKSLVVKHEEGSRTSGLFTAFLLLSAGWLALGAVAGYAHDGEIDPGPSVRPVDARP